MSEMLSDGDPCYKGVKQNGTTEQPGCGFGAC